MSAFPFGWISRGEGYTVFKGLRQKPGNDRFLQPVATCGEQPLQPCRAKIRGHVLRKRYKSSVDLYSLWECATSGKLSPRIQCVRISLWIPPMQWVVQDSQDELHSQRQTRQSTTRIDRKLYIPFPHVKRDRMIPRMMDAISQSSQDQHCVSLTTFARLEGTAATRMHITTADLYGYHRWR